MLHSTNGAVQVSAWIRPPVTSTRAITPSAASSVLPVAAPLCFSLQCSYGGCFRTVRSGHLFVSRPEGKQSLLDLAIADSVSYTCAGRSSQSSPAAIGCDAKLVRDARCMAGRLITNSVVIQASGWIRPPVTSAPAIPPSAASSLWPVAVRMCHASLCASHRPVLKEDFISTPSRLLGLLSQAGAVFQFGCAVLRFVVPVGIASARSAAKHVCDARCMAGRLLTNRAIIQVSAWIRPPVTSTRAITPSAASSVLPVAAPLCFSLQCSYGGCFRTVWSGHLFVSRPEGKQSLLDLVIADSVSYSCAGRPSQSSPAAIGCDAQRVRNPRCMAGRLVTNKAIIQTSGWIRPPVTSTPAIPPSAASSLRPVAAPVCFSLQHRCGKSWWQGQLKGVVSRHLFVSRQEGKQSLVDYAITDSVRCRSPYRCAVSFSPTAAGCFSTQVREWSCAAGLLIKTRAIISVSGWIRPPFASARAGLPAASSLPPATAPVLFSLQCSCRGCFRAVRSGHLFVFEAGRQAVSLGPCDCRFRVLQLCWQAESV